MTIGQRINCRRKEIGVSAEMLAEIIGVSAATIYRYENGDIEKIPADRLSSIADALSTTTYELTGSYTSNELIDIGMAGAKKWANDFRFNPEQKQRLSEFMADYTMRLKETINAMANSVQSGEIVSNAALEGAILSMQCWAANVLPYVCGEAEIKIAPGYESLTEDEKTILNIFRQIPSEWRKVFLDQGRVYADNLKKG